MKSIEKSVKTLGIFTAAALIASPAFAGDLGDFVAAGSGDVSFLDVSEFSPTGHPEPLYGTPTYDGDSLVFGAVPGISATATSGDADVIDARLDFVIEAFDGETLGLITFDESGFYSVLTDTDSVGAIGGAIITLESGGDTVILDVALISDPESFIFGSAFGSWTGHGEIDLTRYDVSSVTVSFDNILTASAPNSGGLAHIDKKVVVIDVDTNVPEPSSLALLGLGGLALIRRRRG